MSVLVPADENECRQLLYTAFLQDHPVAVRYPRGSGIGAEVKTEMTAVPFGKGEVRREGRRIAILAFGTLLYPALQAAERLDATVANMRFVKPLDVELVKQLVAGHHLIVVVEEHQILGGAGSAVCEALAPLGSEKRVLLLGLPDRFIDHGDPARLLASVGLDAQGIRSSIEKAMSD